MQPSTRVDGALHNLLSVSPAKPSAAGDARPRAASKPFVANRAAKSRLRHRLARRLPFLKLGGLWIVERYDLV